MVGAFWHRQVRFGDIWRYTYRVQNRRLQHVPKGEMNMLSAAFSFISTTEYGVINKWERSMHILKEKSVVGGGNIGHHESKIASEVTDDQNTITILIIF